MEGKNESKHTPEWEAKLIFRTDRDKVGVWVVTDLSDGTQLFMKLNTPRAEHHAKLIASAPTLKAENEQQKILIKNRDGIIESQKEQIKEEQRDIIRLQTELSALRAEVDRLTKELKESEENYAGMTSQCKYLTEINVFNMCFDKADSHWRKSHKVEEGENFIDWYMRHHAAEREADRKQIDGLTKEKKELVEVLKESKDMLDKAYDQAPNIDILDILLSGSNRIKSLITRIK